MSNQLMKYGGSAQFYNAPREIGQNGIVNNPMSFPEVQSLPADMVNTYQTNFRHALYALYNPNGPSSDNCIVNRVLENGYNSPLYHAVCRTFTLTALMFYKETGNHLQQDMMMWLARVAAASNPSIKSDIDGMVNDPDWKWWFQSYMGFINNQPGKKFAEVVLKWQNSYGNSQAFGNAGFSHGGGAGGGQSGGVSGGGSIQLDGMVANRFVETQPQPSGDSGFSGGWSGEGAQEMLQRLDGVTYGVDGFNTMELLQRADGWPVVLEGGVNEFIDMDTAEYEAVGKWHIWNKSLSVTNTMVAADDVISPMGLLETSRDPGEMLRTQLAMFSMNNPMNRVCDLGDTPWGLESYLDVVTSSLPSRMVDAVPEEAIETVILGRRAYLIFNASYPEVVSIGKLFGADAATGGDDLYYIAVPYIVGDTQSLMLFNFVKGETKMDLAEYQSPSPTVKVAAEVVHDQTAPASGLELYHHSTPVCNDVGVASNLMAVLAPGKVGVATYLGATFIMLPEKEDREAYAALRAQYDSEKIGSVWDLCDELNRGDYTDYLKDQLNARIQETMMGMLEQLDVPLNLDESWLAESDEIDGILQSNLPTDQLGMIKTAGDKLLRHLFTEVTDEDELRAINRLFVASTGMESRLNNKRYSARLASISDSVTGNLVLGDGIIPLVDWNTLYVLPVADNAINPTGASDISGWLLPEDMIKDMSEHGGKCIIVTTDGIQYAAHHVGASELDAPALIRL